MQIGFVSRGCDAGSSAGSRKHHAIDSDFAAQGVGLDDLMFLLLLFTLSLLLVGCNNKQIEYPRYFVPQQSERPRVNKRAETAT